MTAYTDLKNIFYKNSIISDINNILQWDLSTIMPENSRENRVKQISFLNNLKQELFSSSKICKLFSSVDEEKLSLNEKLNFREMKKEFIYYTALPKKLIEKKNKFIFIL
jgi:Zn-dependent M32 family carboxypeptidase